MNEQETAKIIEGLREQVAWMQETLDKMPPTVERALELHAKWLRNEEGGVRLDLSHADLRNANMREVNLTGADLSGATMDVGKLASGRQGEPGRRSRGRS
jgi:hypothetical protein